MATLARAPSAGVHSEWVTADEVYGQKRTFREWLATQGVPFVLVTRSKGTVPAVGGRPRLALERVVGVGSKQVSRDRNRAAVHPTAAAPNRPTSKPASGIEPDTPTPITESPPININSPATAKLNRTRGWTLSNGLNLAAGLGLVTRPLDGTRTPILGVPNSHPGPGCTRR